MGFAMNVVRFRFVKALLLIVFVISHVSASTSAADKGPLNVFIMAGQSNMAGADSEVAVPPGFQQTEADRATRFTVSPLLDGETSKEYMPW